MIAQTAAVLRSLVFYPVFYGGTALLVLLSLLVSNFSTPALRGVVASWSAFHRWCVNAILGITVEVRGTLPGRGALVAMKHESFFEAIDLPRLLDDPAIFAKAELLRIPLWGKAASDYGLIPVERDQGAKALRAMFAAAKACAAEGRLLAIFPEGTRVAHGTCPPLQSGFAGVYKLLKMPVVPLAVDSGPLYHRWWKHPGTITISVGEEIPAGLPREEIEARVHAAINALNPGSG